MTKRVKITGKKEPRIREFLEWLFEEAFEGCPDGNDIQDKAWELGLLVTVKIPENEREKHEACMEYDTDELYFPYWTREARAAIKSERGRGK